MSTHIFRVVVRGQFDGLDDDRRSALLAKLADHEIFRATYTAEGSFTYEANLVSFSFRFEVRERSDVVDEARQHAVEVGLTKARAHLAGIGVGHKHLRATATDMASMWG